jgi:hypothetical protein
MLDRILISTLVLALLAPPVSADDTAPRLQSAQTPTTTRDSGHPYKWPGLIMVGVGGLISAAALLGAASIEGPSFLSCRADAVTRGTNNDCLGERTTNPSLAGLGVGLMGGGVLIGLHRPARSPQITIGRGRWSVGGRVSF